MSTRSRSLRCLQLRALRLSIRHWEGVCLVVERAIAQGLPADVDVSDTGCECCRVLKDSILGFCIACPIYEYTGYTSCMDTPWSAVGDALSLYHCRLWSVEAGRSLLGACLLEYFYLLFVYEALRRERV